MAFVLSAYNGSICFRWLVLTILLFTLVAPAYANGAMGMVYGTFSWLYCLIHVIVTVIYEAVVLGRWAKLRFFRALEISAWANVVTALLGAWLVSGIFGTTAYGLGARNSVNRTRWGTRFFV
ncbi:MAG: hypothetical protein QM758_15965 [Armatimonas sp.]